MTTVGEFLRDKMRNMHVWLESEGVEVPQYAITTTLATMAAQQLHDEAADSLEARDFDALLAAAPAQLHAIVKAVREHPSLHDKFWRYLTLFSDTVAT